MQGPVPLIFVLGFVVPLSAAITLPPWPPPGPRCPATAGYSLILDVRHVGDDITAFTGATTSSIAAACR